MEMILVAIAILLLLGLAAVGALLWRLSSARDGEREQLGRLAELAGSLTTAQAELGGRLNQLSQQSNAQQTMLTETLQNRLDGVSKHLGESLEKSATKTAESLGDLKKHLNVIDEAQRNIADLAGQVIGLQDILDNKQARGAFGEVQLHDLVTSILPPSAYGFQVMLGNERRADCLIRLPNPPGPICIDSKFPLESYHALRNAADDIALRQAQRDFRAALGKHIADIKARYIVPGETADSALMFLPSEAVYAELHGNFSDIVEQSYRARVWIVSPTTLMATLNTVRAVLKDARMREQAGLIQVEVHKLLDDTQRLDKRVDNLRRHFSQAEGDLRAITTSTEKVVKRAEKIGDVQLADEAEEEVAVTIEPPADAADDATTDAPVLPALGQSGTAG
tara:strand:- start:350 stop:1531 length:1182 start_codon:yes stop_codon:yes gene_type:complete